MVAAASAASHRHTPRMIRVLGVVALGVVELWRWALWSWELWRWALWSWELWSWELWSWVLGVVALWSLLRRLSDPLRRVRLFPHPGRELLRDAPAVQPGRPVGADELVWRLVGRILHRLCQRHPPIAALLESGQQGV